MIKKLFIPKTFGTLKRERVMCDNKKKIIFTKL